MSRNNWDEQRRIDLRREIIRRIMTGEFDPSGAAYPAMHPYEEPTQPAEYIKHWSFHGKTYNLRIVFVMIEDGHSAHRAGDEEADAAMEADAQWFQNTPCWKQNLDRAIVPTFSEEDEKILREMQAHLTPD